MAQHGVADDHIEVAVAKAERPTIPLLEGDVANSAASSAALATNTGEGSTPTASATPGQRASTRVTDPVPQPTSSTRAAEANPTSDR
jgi:hypothetical protein